MAQAPATPWGPRVEPLSVPPGIARLARRQVGCASAMGSLEDALGTQSSQNFPRGLERRKQSRQTDTNQEGHLLVEGSVPEKGKQRVPDAVRGMAGLPCLALGQGGQKRSWKGGLGW